MMMDDGLAQTLRTTLFGKAHPRYLATSEFRFRLAQPKPSLAQNLLTTMYLTVVSCFLFLSSKIYP